MSWDIYFCDPVSRETIELDEPHFMHGGTYCLGGTRKLWMNITYNYAKNYSPHGFCVGDLHGKTAVDIIPELERVIAALGDDTDSDYWKPTDGNAKRALMSVLAMAKMRPDALIRVS